jgi:hypothetical protein
MGAAEKGAVGSFRGRLAQPALDPAGALARADAGGFYTSMPLYHGTARAFSKFDPAKGGQTTGVKPGELGSFFASHLGRKRSVP